MNRFAAVMAFLLAALSGAPSADKPSGGIQDERIDHRVLAGKWQVTHQDGELGSMSGTVDLSENADDLTLVLRYAGQRFPLSATHSRFGWNSMIYRLEGDFPAARVSSGSPPADANLVLAPPGTIRLSATLGKASESVAVRPTEQVVAWELRVYPNRDGTARADWTKLLADGSRKPGGTQAWRTPGPRLDGIVVVYDQTGYTEGVVKSPYPFGNTAHDWGSSQRVLLFWGESLVRGYRGGTRYAFDAMGEPIHYRLRSDSMTDAGHGRDWQQGWERARAAGADPGRHEAILVNAQLDEGVLPGWKRMALNGSPGNWKLQFGDTTAKLSFVREVRAGDFEGTCEVLPMEHVHLQVKTEVPLPLGEIPLQVGVDGAQQRLAGRGSVTVTRVGDGKSTLYRTPPIALHSADKDGYRPPPKSGELPWPVKAGQVLLAKFERRFEEQGVLRPVPDCQSPLPNVSSVRVVSTPAVVGGLWEEALARADRCPGNQTGVRDWAELRWRDTEEVDRITNLFVLTLSSMHVKIKFGHQAAMILLRDTFVDMMRGVLAEFRKIRSSTELMLKFRSHMLSQGDSEHIPFNRVRVKAPDGVGIAYWQTHDVAWVAGRHGLSEEQARRWAFEQTVAGLDAYIASMVHAIDRAQAAGDCDTPELLDVTGLGFHLVVERLLPRLMQLKQDPDLRPRRGRRLSAAEIAAMSRAKPRMWWAPDTVARGWVGSVSTLAQAVKDQRAAKKVDDIFVDILLTAGSVVTPALMGEGVLALVVSIGLDAADVAWTLHTDVRDYYESRAETAFARGASEVLGTGRAEQAELEQTEWFQTAVGVLGSAFGVSMTAVETAAAVNRGARLMNKVRAGGIQVLSEAEKADFFAFVKEAKYRQMKDGADALSPRQSDGLAMVDDYLDQHRIADVGEAPSRTPATADTAEGPVRTADTEAAAGAPEPRPSPGGRAEPEAPDEMPPEGPRLADSGSGPGADGPRWPTGGRAEPGQPRGPPAGGPRPAADAQHRTGTAEQPDGTTPAPRESSPASPEATRPPSGSSGSAPAARGGGREPSTPAVSEPAPTVREPDPTVREPAPDSREPAPASAEELEIEDATATRRLDPRDLPDRGGGEPSGPSSRRPSDEHTDAGRTDFQERPTERMDDAEVTSARRGEDEATDSSHTDFRERPTERMDDGEAASVRRRGDEPADGSRTDFQERPTERMDEGEVASARGSEGDVAPSARGDAEHSTPASAPKPPDVRARPGETPDVPRTPEYLSPPARGPPDAEDMMGTAPVAGETARFDTAEFPPLRDTGNYTGPAPGKKITPPQGFPQKAGDSFTLPDGRSVKLSDPIGEGRLALVYRIDDPAHPDLHGNVLKLLRKPKDGSPVDLPQVVRDVVDGSRKLKQHGIPQLDILHHADSGQPPFLVQKALDPETMDLHDIDEFIRVDESGSRVVGELSEGKQRAVVELYDRLARHDLVWEDGHIENIYFRRLPGQDRWEAGVLDQDRIGYFARGGPESDTFEELPQRLQTVLGRVEPIPYSAANQIESLRRGGRNEWPDARFMMQKLLEYRGRYIRYLRNPDGSGSFEPILIRPPIVRERFPELDAHVDKIPSRGR